MTSHIHPEVEKEPAVANWEQRIEELGIELMDPLPAGGLYAPLVIVGELGFTSGTVAVEGPPLKLAYAGCLGDDIDVETGKLSARRAFISTLSNLRGALGSLDRIERFVKLTGYVRAEDRARILAAGFQAHVPKPVEPVA